MLQRPRLLLTNAQWRRIEPHICGRRHDPGTTGKDNRRFLEAVFWILRTGAPWRDLPGYFGLWNTAYQRFRRWCHRGVWRYVLMAMRPRNRDPVALMDSTVVRAHQHSAGAQKGRTGAVGRSRGGLSTKLHVAVTPQWHLLDWRITAGQAADVASAPSLLQGLGNEIRQIVVDRAYDSNAILQQIVARRCEPVIPARWNRRIRSAFITKLLCDAGAGGKLLRASQALSSYRHPI
jgi:transposase